MLKNNQQLICSSGKGIGRIKYVSRGSIPAACVWKKFDWKEGTNIVCLTNFQNEINHR
jgi:hypothetical protein